MNERYLSLANELASLERRRKDIDKEVEKIQSECSHPRLPKRDMEEVLKGFMDICPDCGFVSYCYTI